MAIQLIRGDEETILLEAARNRQGELVNLGTAKLTFTLRNSATDEQVLQFGHDFDADEAFGTGGSIELASGETEAIVVINSGVTDSFSIAERFGADVEAVINGSVITLAIDDDITFRRDYTRPV